jgi:hypothetical protein
MESVSEVDSESEQDTGHDPRNVQQQTREGKAEMFHTQENRITTEPKELVLYEDVSKSFRTGRPEREQQMVQLCAIRCSCIAILWVSLVSFVAITLCVASQRVFIVVHVYFFMTQSGNLWIHSLKATGKFIKRKPEFHVAPSTTNYQVPTSDINGDI